MASSRAETIHCSVEQGSNLPTEIGGADAVCAAIAQATLPVMQRLGIDASQLAVGVRVVSNHRIAAVASLSGRQLPEHVIDVADRTLNRRAIEMLAAAMAAEVSNANDDQAGEQ